MYLSNQLNLKETNLIAGLGRRDKIVFDYLFNCYYSSLCAFCLHYIDDRDDIEDLVQDFFVCLWMEAPHLKIISLKSYFFSSVKNRCLDYRKHHKITEKYKTFLLFSQNNEEDTAEDFFVESELRQTIQSSLEKLPPRCREIFELSRFNGLSNQEISDKLGISKRTVELQISNSIKSLRNELAEFLPLWLIIWLIG